MPLQDESLSQQPLAIGLDGTELVLISQAGNVAVPWVTKATTVAAIGGYINGVFGTAVSMRQLLAAMAQTGVYFTAFRKLPADQSNSYNIAWNHAYRMPITDPFITGFLQPALSYSDAQMVALYTLALTLPI